MKKFLITIHALLFLSCLTLFTASFAQSGFLDVSFGDSGKVTTYANLNDTATKIVIQPDGKIIMVGGTFSSGGIASRDFIIARYNTDGTLDAEFGTGGLVTTDFGGNDRAAAVAIQQDGKIVVVGTTRLRTGFDFALARYNTDGTLDSLFGVAGKVITDFGGGSDWCNAVTIQTDQKILLAGTTLDTQAVHTDYALMRYNTDGSPDDLFGSLGKVQTDFNTQDDEGNAMALQTDGKILVCGTSFSPETTRADFSVARYNTDGSLDDTFGTGGKVIKDLDSENQYGYDIVIQPDKKFIIGGSFTDSIGRSERMGLFRYNADGTTDSTFSQDGIRNIGFGFVAQMGHAVALDSVGKILLAGRSVRVTGESYFALTILSNTGRPDSAFGTNGRLITSFENSRSTAFDVAVLGDGKIIVAGIAIDSTAPNTVAFALAKYLPLRALPVNLLSFTAVKKEKSILLNWQTASEFDNSYFSIEHNTNGNNNFSEIGKVYSRGNTSQSQQYAYEDFSPAQGGNYYRLKQADIHGQVTYSKTILVDFSKSANIKLYPNPVKDKLTVEGLNASGGSSSISIISLSGNRLAKTTVFNSTSYTWNIKQLPAGTYYVRVEENKKITAFKFIKE